jgi:hypothetical protein
MSYSKGIEFTIGSGNENSNDVTMHIDTAYIKGWWIDECGLLSIETDKEGMKEISDCAASLAM